MTDSAPFGGPARVELFHAACRQAGEQLISKVRTLTQHYRQASGLHPDQVVLLCGTSLVAALVVAGQVRPGNRDDIKNFLPSWTYDRRTGEIRHVSVRARMLVVEDPDLGPWDYRLMVPSDADMLGRPTV